MNWAQFKDPAHRVRYTHELLTKVFRAGMQVPDPASHMCLAGAVVAS